jgi:hypothetical protein
MLAACSHAHPHAIASPPAAPAGPPSVYPAGIVAPASFPAAVRAGIYPASSAAQCCFLAGRTLLVLDNPANARRVVFTFYVPGVKPFLKQKEHVSIALDGVHAATVALALGEQNVTVAIPASVRATRHLIAGLRMSVSFVPKQIGLNADVRELSVVLLKVGYI